MGTPPPWSAPSRRASPRPAGAGSAPLAVALGRYGAARAASPAERVAGLHAALEPLLAEDGAGPWAVAMRAAALVGQLRRRPPAPRPTLRQASRVTRGTTWPSALGEEERLERVVDGVVRTVLVAALEADGGPAAFAELLDGVLLGARPRPQVVDGVARTARSVPGPPAAVSRRRRRAAARRPRAARSRCSASSVAAAGAAGDEVGARQDRRCAHRGVGEGDRRAASGRRSGTQRSAVSAPSTATSAAALARSTSSSADVVMVAVKDP